MEAIKTHKLLSAAGGAVLLLLLIAIIPPFRSVATLAASKVILVVTTPFAPSVKVLDTAPASSKVLAADGSLLGDFDEGERIPIKVADLPPHVTGAILASEDADFYSHDGVDPSAIVRAAFNIATGSRQQGGSTITQQLAKLNYTNGERTVFRKLREVLFATRLERDYSKDQLLERYLNQVYFGDGAYGIEAGAVRTFGVPAAKMTPEQAAAVAVRIRAPGSIDPRKRPEGVLDRRNRVLEEMGEAGSVPTDQVAALQAKPLAPIPLPPTVAKSERLVIDRARREVLRLDVLEGDEEEQVAKLEGGGLTIETTLEPKGQKAAREAAQAALPRPEDASAAVIGVTPGDGAIRVFVGDSKNGEFDVATRGPRQPGSAYKPFTYLTALKEDIHPGTTFDSKTPFEFTYQGKTEKVSNYEEGNGGPTTLDDATINSVNVVYTQLALRVGPEKIKEVAQELGQPESIRALPSLTLGTSEVTPLEMAASYAVFASGGTYAEPYLVNRIKDPTGKVVWQHDKKTRRAMDQKEAGVVNGILQRVVNEGTGKAAAIGRPVAGKTGTTNDSKDAWFVGYTPQLSTAVWVGYVDGARTVTDGRGRQAFGGGPPARIFSSTVRAALQGVRETPFQVNKPEDLGLKLPGAGGGGGNGTTTVPPPPVGNTLPTTTLPPLFGSDTTPPTQPPFTFVPQEPPPPQTTAPPRPARTTTTIPCPTTTTGPPITDPGRTTTTARRPPGC